MDHCVGVFFLSRVNHIVILECLPIFFVQKVLTTMWFHFFWPQNKFIKFMYRRDCVRAFEHLHITQLNVGSVALVARAPNVFVCVCILMFALRTHRGKEYVVQSSKHKFINVHINHWRIYTTSKWKTSDRVWNGVCRNQNHLK